MCHSRFSIMAKMYFLTGESEGDGSVHIKRKELAYATDGIGYCAAILLPSALFRA